MKEQEDLDKMELSTATLTGIVSLFMVLSGVVIIDNIEKSYYCKPEDNTKECISLSPSNATCYTLTGKDLCVGGKWERLDKYLSSKVTKYSCNTKECVRI